MVVFVPAVPFVSTNKKWRIHHDQSGSFLPLATTREGNIRTLHRDCPEHYMGTMCSDLKRWFYDEMPTFAHPISMQVSGRRYFLARLTWWLHRYNMQPCTRCPWAKLWDGSVGSSMKKFGSSEGEHGGFWFGIFRPQQIHGIPKWLTMECLTLMALTVGSSKAPSK